MPTEVSLNGTNYKITRLPVQTLANQMASKVGQGTSEYGDLTTWSAWIQEDWQEGVGKIKPHRNGGFLYGEVESRVPGQLILPPRIGQVQNSAAASAGVGGYRNVATDFTNTYTVGSGATTRMAVRVSTPASGTILGTHKYWIYANIPYGTTLTFALYTNSGSLPGTQITTATYNSPEENTGFYWHGVTITASLSTSTDYWLVVYPTSGTFKWLATLTPESSGSFSASYDGASWTLVASPTMAFSTNYGPMSTSTSNTGAGFFRFNNVLYSYSGNRVWKYDSANTEWDLVGTITGVTAVSGVTVYDTNTYFANVGGDGDYTTMSTAESFTDSGVDGRVFAKWKGLLWKATANYVEYTEDGSTWEPTTTFGEPIYVSDTSDPVTGLCGMGDIMYAFTTAGLVPIYPGDVITGGRTWGSIHPQNGMRSVEYEGALYVTVNGRVVRYTEDGSMQDVWMSRDDDVVAGRIGRVWDLEKVNNWLFAIVGGDDVDDKPTIWAYQANSWHHVATLPNSTSAQSGIVSDYDLYYDRPTQRLWAITPDFVTYWWYIPDYSLNPYNDPFSRYMRSAWVEWDWFDGQILEADKDYDSVTIMGENLSSTCYVEVYWKDDASTGWEFLGTADSNHKELRWTLTGGTRPNTKRFKLGILLFTANSAETPRIRAFRVKYHLMVSDWFRWNVQVDVSGRSGANQELPDGTRNTLTASQIKDNIDALAKRVSPFIYTDVDNSQYEVKITDANFQYTRFEYNESTTNRWWEGVYNLVLEQVTQGKYTA